MCVMEKKHVASTGLMRLEVALRYKHSAQRTQNREPAQPLVTRQNLC